MLLALLIACTDRVSDSVAVCDTTPPEDTGFQVGDIRPSCRCEDAELIIGTGETEFVALTPGQDLAMVHGPQNGWHVPGAVRVCNTRDVVSLDLGVSWKGQAVTPPLSSRVLLIQDQECSGYLPNLYLFLDTTALAEGERDTPPELLSCETVELSMCALDTGGRGQCSTLELRLLPDALDIEAGVAQPCADQ